MNKIKNTNLKLYSLIKLLTHLFPMPQRLSGKSSGVINPLRLCAFASKKTFLTAIFAAFCLPAVASATITVSNNNATVASGSAVLVNFLSSTTWSGGYPGNLTYTIVNQPGHGIVLTYAQYNHSSYDYSFYRYYQPNPGYGGTDTFTWKASSDGTSTAAASTPLSLKITFRSGSPGTFSSTAVLRNACT